MVPFETTRPVAQRRVTGGERPAAEIERASPDEPAACLRILFHHRVAASDGQSVHIRHLTASLRRLGHEVTIVGPRLDRDGEPGGRRRAVPFLKRWLPRALYELFEFAYSIVAYFRLEAACRKVAPDIIYERANLFLPAGVWLKRRRHVPMLLEVNAPLFHEREQSNGIALKRLARWSEEMTWRAADCVLPVTEALAEFIERAGVPGHRIAVIPNGVDAEQFLHGAMDAIAAKRRLGLAGKVVLGFVGFVRDWHGLEGVIDILAEIGQERGIHLLVVGDGPGRASLEQRARNRGVESMVRFIGTVPHELIPYYVCAFDIALQPGTTPYASPLKLVEYMALARAIVAPDTANIRELLVHNETALLFDPALPDALRGAIARACADPLLRTGLGTAARQAVIERGLTWEENARRVVAVARTLQSPALITQQGRGTCKIDETSRE